MSVPDFLVLREGKLRHTSLKVPPTQQAVIGGPVAGAHRGMFPPPFSSDALLRRGGDL